MHISPTSRDEMPKVYSLMARTWPHPVPTPLEAMAVLETRTNLTIKRGNQFVGWLALSVDGNVAKLDIAIEPPYRGKWATKGLIRELGKYIFTCMGLKAVIVECYVPEGIKLAVRMGFELMSADDACVTMGMTPEVFERKWC